MLDFNLPNPAKGLSNLDVIVSLEHYSKAEVIPSELKARRQALANILHFIDSSNTYDAYKTFSRLNDYIGLYHISRHPDISLYDKLLALIQLEDHEELARVLDTEIDEKGIYLSVGMRLLEKPVWNYVDSFLKGKGLTATGMLNDDLDLLAIKQLAEQYDIAVPIARGGLKQGAIAELFGMEIRLLNIESHGRETPSNEWIDDISARDFRKKRVLLFDKDAVTGGTIREAVRILSEF